MKSQTANMFNQSILGDLVEEVFSRLERGEELDIEKLALDYPEHKERLSQLLPMLCDLNALELSFNSHASVDEPLRTAEQRTLGDFRLLRELGRGGMGVVYEAQQLTINRKVALKILPLAAMVDSRALKRFKNEVAAIATLEHPHIVSVYAVGEDRGMHYYAMKLIRGQSLAAVIHELRNRASHDESISGEVINHVISDMEDRKESKEKKGAGPFCAQHPEGRSGKRVLTPFSDAGEDGSDEPDLTAVETRARGRSSTMRQVGDPAYFRNVARLIRQAADAIQHAHDHGIVHRDVKPGNLLLDTSGTLFVTDFGLARIEAGAGVTMTGDMLGTLRYMSPEQVQANRQIVDQRTDVYSLGATLYELLTLQPMWPGEDKAELIRQISHDVPVQPKRVNPSIPTDLETIVLKAINKSPSDRYDNASGLAADLQSYLDLKPIVARRPTTVQRMNRWARRNPALVWTAMVFLLLTTVVAATAGAFVASFAHREHSARLASQERLRHLTNANNLIKGIFKDLNIFEIREGTEPLEAVLATRLIDTANSIDRESLGDPLVVADLQEVLSDALHSLGYPGESLALAQEVWATHSQILGDDHPNTLKHVANLGCRLVDDGWYAKALPLLEDAYARSTAILGNDHETTLHAMHGLLCARMGLGVNEQTREQTLALQVELVKLSVRVFGSDDSRAIKNLGRLSLLHAELGNHNESTAIAQQVHILASTHLGPLHPETLSVQRFLIERELEKPWKEAAPELRKLWKHHKDVHGEGHPLAIESLFSLGVGHLENFEPSTAVSLFEHAYELAEKRFGHDHPITLKIATGIGLAQIQVDNLNSALPLLEDTVKCSNARLGPRHRISLAAANNLAIVFHRMGRLDEALDHWEEILRHQQESLGYDHPSTLPSLFNLGSALVDAGRLVEAKHHSEECVRLSKLVYGDNHFETTKSLTALGRCYYYLDQQGEAAPLFQEAIKVFEATVGRKNINCQVALLSLGNIYSKLGRTEEGIALLEEVSQTMRGSPHAEDADVSLLRAYVEKGDFDKVATLVDRIMQSIQSRRESKDYVRISRTLSFLATAYSLEIADYLQAESLLRECLDIREKVSPDKWSTFNTRLNLGVALVGQRRDTEAEPFLTAGFRGLNEQKQRIQPVNLREPKKALERLIGLYETHETSEPGAGYAQKAAEWRARLVVFETSVLPQSEKSGG